MNFKLDPNLLVSAVHEPGPTDPTQHLSANMFSSLKPIKPPVRPVGNLTPPHAIHGYSPVSNIDRDTEFESRQASPINNVRVVNGRIVPKN